MNDDSQTVYVSRGNLLSPPGLTDVMARFSRQEVIPYVA